MEGCCWTDEIAPVIEVLTDREDELAARQVAAMRTNFSSYQSTVAVPEDSIMAMGRRNVERVISTLQTGAVPRPEDIFEARIARERAEQGIPADEMIAGYRMVQRLLGGVVMDQATALRIQSEVLAQAAHLLWAMADVATSQLVMVRRQAELEMAGHEEFERIDFLRRLLFGGVDEQELAALGPLYGLKLERCYFAVRAAGYDPVLADAARQAVEASGRQSGLPVLAAVIDGDVVAISPERPHVASPGVTVGVGGPVPLGRIDHAFRTASRVLNVARRLNTGGTVGLEELSLRVAVASESELGMMLVDRYLRPLDAEGEFGRLLEETVREYLEAGQRAFETARRLGIHTNTLRYRLDRFEKLTGTYLSNPLCGLELWWALECRRIERQDRIANP